MRDLHLKPVLYPPPLKGRAVEVSYYRGDPHFRYHYHPEFELVLVRGSIGRRLIGNTISSYCNCDLVLLGPYLPHTWASEPELERRGKKDNIVVHFTRESLGMDLLIKRELRGICRLLDQASCGLSFNKADVPEVVSLMDSLPNLRDLPVLLTVFSLLDILARCRKATVLSNRSHFSTLERDHLLFSRILDFIHHNSGKSISLAEAASVLQMSVPTFCRFFRRASGKSFADYLNDWKTFHAGLLLAETSRTITEIAGLVGYNNLSHFNRQFLCRHGMTPRQYRRKHCNPNPV